MLYGIVSDIHSNIVALEAVLADMPEIDRLLCLGDIVGYGPRPNECCEIMRERAWVCIAGNHDRCVVKPGEEDWFNEAARAAILWTREVISEEAHRFLSDLGDVALTREFTLMHGALQDPDEYITSPREALATLKLARTPISLCGHTHVPEAYRIIEDNDGCRRVCNPPLFELAFQSEGKVLVNCGSVGQPRDGDPRAAYGLLDSQAGTVQVKRVAYDIEATQRDMIQAGLPRILAARLSVGM